MPDPCGVPTSTGSHRPLSRMPALSHRSIKRRTRGSAILCLSIRTNQPWSTLSKEGPKPAPPQQNRWFEDSPLERAGFEPSVPRESGFGFAPEGPNVGIQLFQRRAGRSRFPRPVTSENLPITIIAPAEAQPAPHTSLPSRTMAIGRR